jgi:hypothetical protein
MPHTNANAISLAVYFLACFSHGRLHGGTMMNISSFWDVELLALSCQWPKAWSNFVACSIRLLSIWGSVTVTCSFNIEGDCSPAICSFHKAVTKFSLVVRFRRGGGTCPSHKSATAADGAPRAPHFLYIFIFYYNLG